MPTQNSQSDPLKNLCTVKQAAEIRGVHKNAIYDLVNRGKINVVKTVGRVKYLDKNEVSNFRPEKPGRPSEIKLLERSFRGDIFVHPYGSSSNLNNVKQLMGFIPDIVFKVDTLADNDLLTVSEVTEWLGYSESRVKRMIHQEHLETSGKLGGQYLVSKRNLFSFVDWETEMNESLRDDIDPEIIAARAKYEKEVNRRSQVETTDLLLEDLANVHLSAERREYWRKQAVTFITGSPFGGNLDIKKIADFAGVHGISSLLPVDSNLDDIIRTMQRRLGYLKAAKPTTQLDRRFKEFPTLQDSFQIAQKNIAQYEFLLQKIVELASAQSKAATR